MTRPPTPLAEYIEIARRFVRSVNLEKDYEAGGQNGEYIVTPTARAALWRLAEGIRGGSLSRAWTLTGPYGVGKSAFAVFLTRLLCSGGAEAEPIRRKLEQVDSALVTRMRELDLLGLRPRGFLPVLATARRTPAPRCLAEGMVAAANNSGDEGIVASIQGLARLLESSRNGESWDSRQVVNAMISLSLAARKAGFEGLLFVVDELGKLFEYAARYPQRGDIFVLQELAEQAARHVDATILFVGLLHQSFEDYGQHLDLATRREWSKIQGRFEDIAFLEPADQVIRMIAQAIRWAPEGWQQIPGHSLDAVVKAATKAGAAPPGLAAQDFGVIAKAAYPLHPVTLVALPFLFRRFAQNERSLFSYLSSLEPYGFQEFVKTHSLGSGTPSFIRLGDLFDYFTKNLGAGLYRHPHALRWLEAADALERKEHLAPLHREIVKTVGVLNALGEFCHLKATEDLIAAAVSDSPVPSAEVQDALRSLREDSVLSFRKFNRTYRIWEGSDVDIEERIAEGERRVRQGLHLADKVREYLPPRPMVARRHSFETGALRFFAVEYTDDPADVAARPRPPVADGMVLVCLAESPHVAESFRQLAIEAGDRRDTLFAIPSQIGELRALITELGALRWAWDNTPELRDDRVARREMSMRIADAAHLVQRSVQGLLDPRDEPVGSGCLWIRAGKEVGARSPREVSQALSDACDGIFPAAPKILNELISRRMLSSAAAAARRNLIERMLTRCSDEALGIQGYPPERSIYESVLRKTGLHRQDERGHWSFQVPPAEDPGRLRPVWDFIYATVFADQPGPVPLESLFAALALPPYGVLAGLQPVLLCAFLLAHPDETTLYREGTFLPEPGIADFEVLMRRPDLFAVAGSRVLGARSLVVARLAKSLGVKAATVPVVRALFRMVGSLPPLAWQTRRLPETTQALRQAFQSAKSPERFLFDLLPQALGEPALSPDHLDQNAVERFFASLNANLREWSDVAPRTISTARDELLNACGLAGADAGWSELRHLAIALEPSVTETQLLAFLHRVAESGADSKGVESVLGLVANRPPHTWHDADIERFPQAAVVFGRSFRAAACREAEPMRLSPAEQAQKKRLLARLRECLRQEGRTATSRAIRAALQNLLKEQDE